MGMTDPARGKCREVNHLVSKSQGKSTAWPDLGFQSAPPNALATRGLHSQKEERGEGKCFM